MPFLTRQPETSVLTKRAGRPRRPLVVVALLGALAALVFTSVALASTPVAVGFKDHAYGGGASRATGDKPQSKLWFAGGKWYGGLFTPTTANRYRIYRLDGTNWVSTGVDVDLRDGSHADYLFDAAVNKLYVVSAGQPVNGCTPATSATTADDLLMYRYTFSGGTHTLDPGFPVVLDTCGSYTATIAKDSLGILWVAYPQGVNVMINHSTINNATWGTPYRLPVQTVDIEPSFTGSDPDISAITAFGGTNIGVAWTNHDTSPAVTRFAVHADGGADDATAWGTTAETALAANADDHLNMKTDPDGNVWIVTKTGLDNDPVVTKPLIQLLRRSSGGAWTTHLVSTVADLNTRPQLLISDTNPRVAYVLMTSPNGGGAIYYKSAPIDGPAGENLTFATGTATIAMPGVPFIKSAVEVQVDDVTTTKQNVTSTMGVVGEASDRVKKVLLHNQFAISAADGTDPAGTVAIAGGALSTPTATVSVDVPATDAGSGVSQVRLANTGGVNGSGVLNGAGATTFAYTTPVTWTMAAGDGAKTVFVQWRDGAGNWSTPISDTIDLDATGPTGNVEINGGDATTNIGSVSVDVTATDPNGVTNVRLSNTSTVDVNGVLTDGTTFPYSTPLAWVLTPENGTKTVYAQWQDGLGTWSGVDSDSIDLDSPDTTFTPVTPARMLDSRGAPFGPNPVGVTSFFHTVPQSFDIAGRGDIPADAVAISGNLAVVGQQRAGYVALGPSVASAPTTSTINFPLSDVRANGVIVPLANDGSLQAVYVAGGSGAAGKKTDLVLDVTGYFTETTADAEYFPVSPSRFLDTRVNNPAGAAILNPSVPFGFQVGGRTVGSAAIPADAVAVTGNLAVTGQTKAGYLSLTPTSQASPTTSTLNFPVGDTRSNNVTAPLGPDGKLYVVYKGSGKAHAIFDVTGYFLDDAAGLAFVPLTPTRTVDTRIDLGITNPLNATTSKSFAVRDEAGVTNDAEAFTGNLAVVGQTKAGYVALTPESIPAGVTPPNATINFPVGDIRANGFAGPINESSGEAWVTFRASPSSATVQIIVDVTGYFH
jgi:flagellin-like hook-associated protein FlgL